MGTMNSFLGEGVVGVTFRRAGEDMVVHRRPLAEIHTRSGVVMVPRDCPGSEKGGDTLPLPIDGNAIGSMVNSSTVDVINVTAVGESRTGHGTISKTIPGTKGLPCIV
jgi:hypothetical protein